MKFGLREKMIGSMLLISITISLVLSAVFYTNSREVIEKNYKGTIERNLEVCAGVFDDVMREAYYTAVNASGDETLKELLQGELSSDVAGALTDDLSEEAGSDSTDVAKESFLDILSSYRTGHVASVYCYIPKNGLLYKATAVENGVQKCDEKDLIWISRVFEGGGNPFSPLFAVDTTELLKKEVFTYKKPVKNEKDETVAWILVNVDERDVFFFCLQGYGMLSKGSSSILTSEDVVASGTDLKQLGEKIQEPEQGIISVMVEAPLTKYKMLTRTDDGEILGNIKAAGTRIFALAFVFNILLLLPILLIEQRMLAPIKNLEEVMIQAGEGDLTVQAEVFADDEIGSLSRGFNRMINQVEELIDALVKEQALKKEAEIEALKYQITPHFMYNTLNSIRYAASLRGEKEIAELLEAFIQLLQMSASDRGAFITVDKEMQMVRNYVRLQRFRYGEAFEAEFRIDERVKDCFVPSLMVQPLVENSLLHGIDLKKGGDKILISASREDGSIVISVSDNGRGMTKPELQRLLSGEQKSKFSGIGIRNVRERLELYYHGNAYLHIESEKDKGTKAILILPVSVDAEEYTL